MIACPSCGQIAVPQRDGLLVCATCGVVGSAHPPPVRPAAKATPAAAPRPQSAPKPATTPKPPVTPKAPAAPRPTQVAGKPQSVAAPRPTPKPATSPRPVARTPAPFAPRIEWSATPGPAIAKPAGPPVPAPPARPASSPGWAPVPSPAPVPSAAEPAWIEVAAPTAAYSSFGQAQTTLGTVEPDMFWPSDVPRYPSLEQDTFFPQAKPPAEQEFLSRTAMNPTRLGAVLLGIGFFSVFVAQMSFELQLVLGAPVFEEFFKFGLALFLVSWIRTPPGHPARWAVILLRLVVAAAVGAGFGVLEHFFSYGDEGALLIWFRVLFHGGSCLLSMACYTILEAGPTRLLWASTFLSSVVHYANNVGAVPVGLLGTITSDTVPLTYTFGLTAVAYLLVAFVFIRPDLLRRLATRLGRSARLVA